MAARLVDPASSIINSQFGPHLSPNAGKRHGISRETFSQLRQEIVGHGDGSQLDHDQSIPDTHNLICVVIKAGIEPLPRSEQENTPEDEMHGQLLDCLDIIHLAMQRVPRVLHEIVELEITEENVRVPLFVWLVYHIISIVFLWDHDAIRRKACSIISAMRESELKIRQLWHSSQSISVLLYGCVNG